MMKNKFRAIPETWYVAIVLFVIFCFSRALFAQQNPGAQYQSHSFQYVTDVLTTAAPVGQVVSAWNGVVPPKYYALSVTTTGSGFTVALEGSLDKTSWSTLVLDTSPLTVTYVSSASPSLYLRTHLTITGSGASVTATAIGVP